MAIIRPAPNAMNVLNWENAFENGGTWGLVQENGAFQNNMRPQAYKDTSRDTRRNLSSFFAFGKRSSERDAYRQAHMTPTGVPGVLHLAVCDAQGTKIPFAPFEWNGRQMITDNKGMFKYIEKDYFQTAISLENERMKYVTQMISLVVGQPAESVIALFGFPFYEALAGCDYVTDRPAQQAIALYRSYLLTAGIDPQVANRKIRVFERYATAECSPEVMCNYGDNDPEWSKAFNKLSMLIEYHPSAILFDSGTLNPLDSAGKIHGDDGNHNASDRSLENSGNMRDRFPDPNQPSNEQRRWGTEAAARVAATEAALRGGQGGGQR